MLRERWRTALFGTISSRGGRRRLSLDPKIGNADWALEGAPTDLPDGAHVTCELEGDVARHRRTVEADEAGLEAVLVGWGIRRRFPDDCLKAAATARPRETARRDLRAVPTITIDAPKSKDLDDALAVLPAQPDGAVRVLVSIADVDAAVPAGSALDVEARRRMTSVYLPDCVVPMLPPQMSEDTLSLLPGVERATLTVELRVDAEGDVVATDLYPSLIRSSARLSYDDVAAFLDAGNPDGPDGGVPEVVRPTLRWLRAAAARLTAARATRGGVNLDRDEVHLTLDPETHEPTALTARELTSAHTLVERLMVAANEAVAGWLQERGLPGVFRVQAPPDAEQIAELAEFAHNFGFETGFGAALTPSGLAAFEAQFESSTVAGSMRTVLRWALGRARYTVHPSPHFALAAPLYLHFTSPIRRYADLLVHRIVKAHLAGDREQIALDPALEEVASDLNEAAYRAGKAETERLRCLVARLFSTRIGESFSGNVVSVKPFGLVVQLAGLGVTGTVSIDALPDGPYHLDAATHSLVGKQRRYVVGEPLEVQVSATDERQGRLELVARQP